MATSQLTLLANRMTANILNGSMASSADDTFLGLKDAYSSGKLPLNIRKFIIRNIIDYFLHIRAVCYNPSKHSYMYNIARPRDISNNS